MTTRHIVGLLITNLYVLLVGFMEFEPVEDKFFNQTFVSSVPMIPMESSPIHLSVSKNERETSLSYEEHVEKEKAARVISKMYRHIDYIGAMQLVTSVYENAKLHNIKPSLLLAMIATESSFKRTARSGDGAIGFLQVIPRYHQNKIQGRNLWATEVNVEVGSLVLRDCYRRHRTEKRALACYNGAVSPDKVEKYYQQVTKNHYILQRAMTRLI